MPSPFPGMDPYLESRTGATYIHASLVVYASDALQPLLQRTLRSRIDERDTLDLPEATERFIKIIDIGSGNRVVTVIEFIISNKPRGESREQYLRGAGRKRSAPRLQSGRDPPQSIRNNDNGEHHLLLQSATAGQRLRGKLKCTRCRFRERLPTIKIPLRPTDADVPLDLQPLIDQCYRNGGYEGTLDYSVDPEPPLVGAEKEWAETMLVEKGLRTKKSAPRKRKPK